MTTSKLDSWSPRTGPLLDDIGKTPTDMLHLLLLYIRSNPSRKEIVWWSSRNSLGQLCRQVSLLVFDNLVKSPRYRLFSASRTRTGTFRESHFYTLLYRRTTLYFVCSFTGSDMSPTQFKVWTLNSLFPRGFGGHFYATIERRCYWDRHWILVVLCIRSGVNNHLLHSDQWYSAVQLLNEKKIILRFIKNQITTLHKPIVEIIPTTSNFLSRPVMWTICRVVADPMKFIFLTVPTNFFLFNLSLVLLWRVVSALMLLIGAVQSGLFLALSLVLRRV